MYYQSHGMKSGFKIGASEFFSNWKNVLLLVAIMAIVSVATYFILKKRQPSMVMVVHTNETVARFGRKRCILISAGMGLIIAIIAYMIMMYMDKSL